MKIQPATGDYEIDRQRHVKPFVERLPNEIDKLTWPLEKLYQLRNERLIDFESGLTHSLAIIRHGLGLTKLWDGKVSVTALL